MLKEMECLVYATVAVGAAVAGISAAASAAGAAMERLVGVTIGNGSCRTVCLCGSAVFADMAWLAALVASLACCIQWTTIWCRAVA